MREGLIERINALANKAKTEGLTDEEKKEQEALRKEYIAEFRKNLRAGIESIVLEYPDGREVQVKDLRKKTGEGSGK